MSLFPSDARVDVDGAFKTPTLRNIWLTGPFFHNGRYPDLESVVDFYNRGSNVQPVTDALGNVIGDTTGTGPLGQGEAAGGSNLDPAILPLGPSEPVPIGCACGR